MGILLPPLVQRTMLYSSWSPGNLCYQLFCTFCGLNLLRTFSSLGRTTFCLLQPLCWQELSVSLKLPSLQGSLLPTTLRERVWKIRNLAIGQNNSEARHAIQNSPEGSARSYCWHHFACDYTVAQLPLFSVPLCQPFPITL